MQLWQLWLWSIRERWLTGSTWCQQHMRLASL